MVEVREEAITPPPLDWGEWEGDQPALLRSYDKERDILFVHLAPKRPAISLDVGGHFWVRYEPQSGKVLSLEIEDFEQVFLATYPELRIGWTSLKPTITKRFRRRRSTVEEYLLLLIMHVKEILRTHPHQIGLAPV